MKQLRIEFNVYDQKDVLVRSSTYTTTYWDEMFPNLISTALSKIKSAVNKENGYYTITSIAIDYVQEL